MSQPLLLDQPSLQGFCAITDAVATLAGSNQIDARGAIYTRREVVDFILDLVGYKETEPLFARSLLEPSFGAGDFLAPAIDRLLASRSMALLGGQAVGDLSQCIRAVELHSGTFEATRQQVVGKLIQAGFDETESRRMAAAWLVEGDFLLTPFAERFDFVIGNPPYVQQELIPSPLLQEYRKRYSTLFDRADLYVPFIERSLSLLAPGGQLGFICADRWMKNRYGGPLREFVASRFHLRVVVDMVDTPAFHADVIAYPAIMVIGRETPGPTRVAVRPALDERLLATLAKSLRGESGAADARVQVLAEVASGSEPWVLHASTKIDLVRRIEAMFPTLEEAGCKVGIGVATGADSAYIGTFEELDVEPDRKLPLVTTRDIVSGHVVWLGKWVVNPFTDEGPLVDLDAYPKLRKHLELRKSEISARHVAHKTPANWYRTIDRITPSLALKPKLLIPDIKGDAQVVFEEGKLYPHHNLYFIVSEDWDWRALQALLLSKLTRLFVATYSTKMRGGFLRFQAQYLRRIRVPRWNSVSVELRARLADAAERLDLQACDDAVAALYRLTPGEVDALTST